MTLSQSNSVKQIVEGEYSLEDVPNELLLPLKVKLYQIQACLIDNKVEKAKVLLEDVLQHLRKITKMDKPKGTMYEQIEDSSFEDEQ